MDSGGTPSQAEGALSRLLLPVARFDRGDSAGFSHAATVMWWGVVSALSALLIALVELAGGGSAGWPILAGSAAMWLLVALFRRGGSTLAMAHALVATQLLLMGGLIVASAGRMLGVSMILPFFTFMAIVVLPRRHALAWVGFGVACLLSAYWLNQSGTRVWLQPSPHWVATAIYRVPLLTLVISTLAGLAFMRIYHAQMRLIGEGRERERRLSEEAAASAARIRTITDNLPAVISFVDQDERYQFRNAGNVSLVSLPPAQVLGKTVREAHGEEMYARVRPHIQAALAGERSAFDGQVVVGGKLKCFQAEFLPERRADGTVAGYYSMTFDVTAQKLAELQARESERRMRLIADAVPVAISYIDPEGYYQFNNLRYQAWFSRPLQEITGHHMREVMGEQAFQLVRPHLERALAGETVDFDLQLLREGEPRYLRGRYTPDKSEQGTVAGLVGMMQDVTHLELLKQALERRANLDALTGLPNRYRFDEHLAEALARFNREGGSLGLLYIDIDRFKEINDRLGHPAGDAALLEFGQRISRSVRATDFVARLAGDEFAVLAENVDGDGGAARLADKILAAMATPMDHNGQPIVLGSSIGIAMARPGDTPEGLVKRADAALYAAKAERGSARLG